MSVGCQMLACGSSYDHSTPEQKLTRKAFLTAVIDTAEASVTALAVS